MKSIGLFFLYWFLLGIYLNQNIEVNLTVDPNPSPYISDWETNPGIANLTIQSFDPQELQLTLEAELTEAGLGIIAQAQSQQIMVLPNDFIDVNCASLLVNESVQYNTDLEQQIMTTGRIPEGDYQLCIHVFEEPGHQLIETVCQPFFIQQLEPVALIYPVNETVEYEEFTHFQWQPAGTTEPVQYMIMVSSVFENQTPEEAIQQNVPLVEDFTQESNFPIDWSLLDVDPAQ